MKQRSQKSLQRKNESLKKHEKKADAAAPADEMILSEDIGGYASNLSASKSYAGYLLRSLRASSIYRRLRKALLWISRLRILSTAMKILSYAVAIIEAGTHIVIASTLILILLPIGAIIAVTTLILSAIGQKRANEYLARAAEGEKTYVFFPRSRSAMADGSFLRGFADELSQNGNATVFIVSPSFWSGAGFDGRKYYLHYRQDRKNVFMLRKYYYFSFKRNVLNTRKEKRITLIY